MPHKLPFPTSKQYSHFRPTPVIRQIAVNVRLNSNWSFINVATGRVVMIGVIDYDHSRA